MSHGEPSESRAFALGSFSLNGLNAVITGAAQGIGAAIARAFCDAGANLALCDRKEQQLTDLADELRTSQRTVLTNVLDVRDEDAVHDWINGLPETFGNGCIDIVVNNAGGTFHGTFLSLSSNARQALIEENFTSVAMVTAACTPHMARGGSIINITSVEAFKASPGFAIYGAMKAAVEHLTRSLALELSEFDIRVNSIAPDALRTPGDAQLLLGGEDYGAKLALGWGEPEDICGAAVFLASSASRYITGSTIHVDGGSNASRGWHKGPLGWLP